MSGRRYHHRSVLAEGWPVEFVVPDSAADCGKVDTLADDFRLGYPASVRYCLDQVKVLCIRVHVGPPSRHVRTLAHVRERAWKARGW